MKTLLALVVLWLAASSPVAVFEPQGACVDGCKVTWIAWPNTTGIGGSVVYDAPEFPGHGICECLFTTCVTEAPCSETIYVTFYAGAGNVLCHGLTSYGENETVPVSVYGCGDLDKYDFGVCKTTCQQACQWTNQMEFSLACGLCNGGC